MNEVSKMRFNMTTLGCKVNSFESEALINDLIAKGWEYVSGDQMVDVCIINTCTVTSTSDQKSRQMIRSLKRKYPEAIIVAMGCYVQLHAEEAADLANITIGTNNRLKVSELVESYLNTKNEIKQALSCVENALEVTTYEEMKVSNLMTHTRGFIKIQDGCENFCSYCAIPYARGKIRSRDPENVINEIKHLVDMGTKEIIISGINTGTYGQDLGDINLAKLICRIMEETALYRLRLSSIELMEVSDELLNVITKYQNRVAHHLHIPLQGGSDAVLKRMNRKYLTADYRALITKIRARFPNIAITTDCLAGFVGETETEFKETCDFIEEMKFASMHIFPYSRRQGTKADQMDGHLDKNIINERAHILQAIAKKMKADYEHKFIGTIQDVLVETKKGNYYLGHTSNYLDVYIEPRHEITENTIVKVSLDAIIKDKIYGKEI